MVKPILLFAALAVLAFASPAAAQRAYTAQEIANGGGIVYKKEVRQKVVQGPTMTFRDVGKGNLGYLLWGYQTANGPYFRLVALPYKAMRKVDTVRFDGLNTAPEFTPQRRLVNVQIGFGRNVYDHGLRNGLTVHLSGDVEKSLTVPQAYFRGFDAWWRKAYP